jgi:hypothetical protein
MVVCPYLPNPLAKTNCSYYVLIMTYRSPPLAPGETIAPTFTPVPMARNRHNGWTEERQRQFIMALAVVGSVDAAAKMIQISRKSAYQLRARPEAKSFARAWDIAISAGRARLFDYMMDRAINGVTTITLKLGGAVEVAHGLDGQLVTTQLRAPLPGEDRFGGLDSGA